mgnify:CR=1 FL=1
MDHLRKKLGTGWSIINILNKLNKNFYIFNGDTLFDFNYTDLKINIKNFLCLIAGRRAKKMFIVTNLINKNNQKKIN